MEIIYFLLALVSIVATGIFAGAVGFGLLYWSVTRNYDSDEYIEKF